ncbi:uncharacterized protein LOC143280324 [Babylonia areolata]|uniref:uncharacterized protein LOC143280324 n=1 Tax=Babylonia areolata TaxID=304850 RepID=UPI003FD3340F
MTKQVDEFLLNLYKFYHYSSANRAMLERAAAALDIPFLVPTRVGGTRWVSHVDRALVNLTRAMPAIKAHLEQITNPDCTERIASDVKNKAIGFLRMINEPRFALTTAFLRDLFVCLAKCSKSLHESKRGISGVYSALNNLKSKLVKLSTSDGPCRREEMTNILKVMDFLLSLPSHSADCERGFSLMKRVKTDWRSRLRSDTLTDLMVVKLQSPDVSDFDPLPSINHWSKCGPRKRRPNFQKRQKTEKPESESEMLEK